MVWDEGTIRHLRDLWARGLSTAEIGRRLGVTKNAIVGKAHRLDLDGRPSPIRRDARPRDASASQSHAAGSTLPPLPSAQRPQAAGIKATLRPGMPNPASAAAPQSAAVQPLRIVPTAPRNATSMTAAFRPDAPRPGAASPGAPRPGAASPAASGAAAIAPASLRRPAPACCWPIGEPGTKAFRFCDDGAMPGKPYCVEHAKLAYVRIKDRKEDAA